MKYSFSPMETKMLTLLQKHGALNTMELADLYYGKDARPRYATVVISAVMRSIEEVAIHNKEPFRIEATGPVGRGPTSYKVVALKKLRA